MSHPLQLIFTHSKRCIANWWWDLNLLKSFVTISNQFLKQNTKNANNLRNCCIRFYLKMDHATDLKQGQPACLTCRLALLTCRSDGPMGHLARPTEPSRTTTTTVLQDSRTQTQSQILVPSRQRMENKVEYVVEKNIIETGSETSLWPSLLICLS